MNAIAKAAKIVGNQRKLAEKLDVHPSMISQMVNGKRRVPPVMCKSIMLLTAGAITCEELRPDIFFIDSAA